MSPYAITPIHRTDSGDIPMMKPRTRVAVMAPLKGEGGRQKLFAVGKRITPETFGQQFGYSYPPDRIRMGWVKIRRGLTTETAVVRLADGHEIY